MQNIKLGFIGFGNMAQAMVKGLLLKEVLPADQIYACAKNWEKLERTTGSFGIHPCHDAREVAEQADLVIVAVKPYLVKEVLEPVRDLLKEKAIVSVAAGLLFEHYEEILGTGYHHLSTQPNTPVSVGEGVFVCENRHSLTAEQFETFQYFPGSAGGYQTVRDCWCDRRMWPGVWSHVHRSIGRCCGLIWSSERAFLCSCKSDVSRYR